MVQISNVSARCDAIFGHASAFRLARHVPYQLVAVSTFVCPSAVGCGWFLALLMRMVALTTFPNRNALANRPTVTWLG